jgi:hypothetical protein
VWLALPGGAQNAAPQAPDSQLEPVVGFGLFKAQFRDKITHISSVIKRDLPLLARARPCSFADVFADSAIAGSMEGQRMKRFEPS